MVTNIALKSGGDWRTLLEEVSRELVVTGIDDNDGVISLPSTYPSGTPVVVRVRRDRNEFIVTDGGYGYQEAEHMGGIGTFGRIAPSAAGKYGVKFDGQMMFAVEVSRDRLANAIIFTGAASRRSVELTAEKLAEERDNSNKDRMHSLLRAAFKDKAAFEVEFTGRSTKHWRFDAIVRDASHWVLFDMVTAHHVSINSSIVKFQDVMRLEDGPDSVAILTNKKAMDSADISLLSNAAGRIVTLDTPPQELALAA